MKTFSAMNNFNADELGRQAKAAAKAALAAKEPNYDIVQDHLGIARRMVGNVAEVIPDLFYERLGRRLTDWNNAQPMTCVGFFGQKLNGKNKERWIQNPVKGARGYVKDDGRHYQQFPCKQLMCPTCWFYRMLEMGRVIEQTRFPFYQVRATNTQPYTEPFHPSVMQKFKAAATKRKCVAVHYAISFDNCSVSDAMEWRCVGLFGSYEPIKPTKTVDVLAKGDWVGAVIEQQFDHLTDAYYAWLLLNYYPYYGDQLFGGVSGSGDAMGELLYGENKGFRMRQDDLDRHLAHKSINTEACIDLSLLKQDFDRLADIEDVAATMRSV